MKKRDYILILGVIFIAFCGWLVIAFLQKGHKGKLRVTVDGLEYGEYWLDTDIEIEIGDTNICRIAGGQVLMIYGACPDQVCVHTNAISKKGQTIICMPNHVVLEIIEGTDSPVDTISE